MSRWLMFLELALEVALLVVVALSGPLLASAASGVLLVMVGRQLSPELFDGLGGFRERPAD